MQKVIERTLNLLAFLLTVGRPVTADEIRHTVKGYEHPSDEAFRRTFERDKDLLRSLGVPLHMRHTDVWEVEVGYVIPADDYSIDLPAFSDDERSALLLAAQAVRFGGQPTELGAIFKLGGAKPSGDAGTVYADLGHDLEFLGSVYEAVTQKRLVEFRYRDRDRSVEPYGLVHRHGHWYLAAHETGTSSLVKAFRVDRMSKVRFDEHAGAFVRPQDFEASRVLTDIPQEGAHGMRAQIRFDADVASVASSQVQGAVVVGQDESGLLLDVPVATQRSLFGWVLGFDHHAVIESPPDVRRAFVSFVQGAQ